MKLYFSGHQETYAVEQTLLTLFPQERPSYPTDPPGGDNELELSFSQGAVWCTATAVLRRAGETYTRRCRCRRSELPQEDPVVATRMTRRTLQRAFYLAAVDCLGTEPPWGLLSGVRPVKLPTRALEAGATPQEAQRQLRTLYRVSPVRRQLAMDCAQESLRVKRSLHPEELSLYVGIPFCPTRCAYCSFISSSGSANQLIPQYLEGLLTEVAAAGAAVTHQGGRVRSVYLGGGTPTTLSPAQLQQLLEAIRKHFPRIPGAEFTVEAGRPDSITQEKLDVLREAGVDRISVNPQTMSDAVLEAIGRSHSAQDVRSAYHMARETGFDVVNMDLIAGLPTDTPASFRTTLEEVLELAPENITVHTLSLKRGAQRNWQPQDLPDGPAVAEMLDYAWPTLRERGYRPYYLYRQKFMSGSLENVGWCRPGYASVYNICMMEELHAVLALGAGGVTKQVGDGQVKRLSNPKYPQEYLRELPRIVEEKRAWTWGLPQVQG